MTELNNFLEQNFDRFDNTLIDFLKIPSISAQPERKDDMRAACEFLMKYLSGIGFEPRICETAGHPIVYAEHLKAKGKPTALIYGHYDVRTFGQAWRASQYDLAVEAPGPGESP